MTKTIRIMRLLSTTVLFLTILLGATASSASAQLVRSWGLKVGATSAGADVSAPFELDRRTGFQVMTFIEWLDVPIFSLVTEAGYAQRGFSEAFEERDQFNNFVQRVEAITRLDYATVNILAKLRVDAPVVTPYVMVGPRIDFLLGNAPGTADFTLGSFESDVASFYDSSAYGLTIAAGLATSTLLPVLLSVEVRYETDLTESMRDVARNQTNNAYGVLLGVAW